MGYIDELIDRMVRHQGEGDYPFEGFYPSYDNVNAYKAFRKGDCIPEGEASGYEPIEFFGSILDVFQHHPFDIGKTIICEVTIPKDALVDMPAYGACYTDLLMVKRIVPWHEIFQLVNMEIRDLSELVLNMTDVEELPRELNDIFSFKPELVLGLIGEMATLPDSIGNLENLKRLDLSGCDALEMLPDSIGNLKLLQALNLYDSGITELPDGIGKLEKLEELYLDECEKLVSLPECIGNCKNLKVLDLSYTGIEQLPDALMEQWESGRLQIYGFHPPRRQRAAM